MTRIYQQTDALIYKNIRQDSAVRLIFLSGLGSPIRWQREGFFRRFALTQGISYMALDYTKYALQYKLSEHFKADTFFDKTKELFEAFPEDKFLLFGSCFGGLMGLKITQAFPSKIAGAVLTSPAYEMSSFLWRDKADSFLHQKFKEKTHAKNVAFYQLKRLAILHRLFTATTPLAQEFIPHSYQGPMTIIHGEKDPLVPVQNSFQIQLAMQNPNLELKVIPNMKHAMAFDKEMKKPIGILKQYLDRLKSPLN